MILVLGIGNPLRSDDGVGIRVVEEIRKRRIPGVVAKVYSNDFDLVEARKYNRIVVVDAVKKGNKPGTIYCASVEEIPPRFSSHSTGFELWRCSELPEITVIAVEAEDVETISERCTPAVEMAISEILNIIENLSVTELS